MRTYIDRRGESTSKMYKQWINMSQRARKRTDCRVTGGFDDYEFFREWCFKNGWFEGCNICRNGDIGDYSPDNCRIDTRGANVAEAMAKTYRFIDPEGSVRKIYNLQKFCRENNLHSGHMGQVFAGNRGNHKGWTKV